LTFNGIVDWRTVRVPSGFSNSSPYIERLTDFDRTGSKLLCDRFASGAKSAFGSAGATGTGFGASPGNNGTLLGSTAAGRGASGALVGAATASVEDITIANESDMMMPRATNFLRAALNTPLRR